MESLFGAINAVLPLEDIIPCLTSKPKERFNIKQTTIDEGQLADITFFDPKFVYTFSKKDIVSTSKNSIFLEKKLTGKAYGIFANNQLVLNQ